ncbi:MAG: hypothetical protein HeimC3_02990 [Candidatus Heimdallarchaeota archaeon LC_3]|nr:MAG: hypothetical protein HeimC3_02990 [Candidatus Heimdallarchaeota archaeon LC_3]
MEVLALIVIVFVISAQVSQASSLPMSTVETNQEFGEITPPVRTINTKFEVQEQNDTWIEIHREGEGVTQNIVNGSLARFKGSFYNEGEVKVVLKSFTVNMLNKTSVLITHTFDYSLGSSQQLEIAPYTSKTQNLESHIYIPEDDQSFIFQIGFTYVDPSNTTNELFAKSAYNFTLNMRISGINPPELIVTTFYLVTLLILIQLGIGYYGNRNKTVEIKKPKYSR